MTQIVPIFTSGQVLYSARPELLFSAPKSFSYNYPFVCTPKRAFRRLRNISTDTCEQLVKEDYLQKGKKIKIKIKMRRILNIPQGPDANSGFVAHCFLRKESCKFSLASDAALTWYTKRSLTASPSAFPKQNRLRNFGHQTFQRAPFSALCVSQIKLQLSTLHCDKELGTRSAHIGSPSDW